MRKRDARHSALLMQYLFLPRWLKRRQTPHDRASDDESLASRCLKWYRTGGAAPCLLLTPDVRQQRLSTLLRTFPLFNRPQSAEPSDLGGNRRVRREWLLAARLVQLYHLYTLHRGFQSTLCISGTTIRLRINTISSTVNPTRSLRYPSAPLYLFRSISKNASIVS